MQPAEALSQNRASAEPGPRANAKAPSRACVSDSTPQKNLTTDSRIQTNSKQALQRRKEPNPRMLTSPHSLPAPGMRGFGPVYCHSLSILSIRPGAPANSAPHSPDMDKAHIRALIAQLTLALGEDHGRTLGELVSRWVSEHVDGSRLAASTRKAYRRQAGRLLEWFGGDPLDSIGPRHAEQIAARLKPEEAGNTTETLRRILKWGRESGWMTGPDPLRSVPPYQSKQRLRVLTPEEQVAMWRELGEMRTEVAAIAGAACRLVLVTGVRASEAAMAAWQHVDLAGRTWHVPTSKTGSRDVTLPAIAVALLDSLPRAGKWVFPVADGGPVRYEAMYRAWLDARRRAGVHGAGLHACRHTIASQAFELGASLPVVSKMLGHRSPSSTMRYAHAPQSRVLETIDQLTRKIGGKS